MARSGRLSTTDFPGLVRTRACSMTDGQVDLVHVVVPVDGAGIEAEAVVVLVVAGVPQVHEAVDPVAGVGLGVGAVELDVAEGPLGQCVTILDPGGQLRLLAPDRQGREQPLGEASSRLSARRSWRCTRPRPGKDHSGTLIGWPRSS